MRRVVVLVVALVMLPSAAGATELGELLERGRDAAYTAEQVISCSTPDGVRDALVRIEQAAGEIRISSSAAADTEVTTGLGGWALHRQGGVVEEARVGATPKQPDPLYQVEDLGSDRHLGRAATAYQLVRDGVLRAELVFDDASGALVYAATFDADGQPYCVRRFVSFDPKAPQAAIVPETAAVDVTPPVETDLPDVVAGFTRLDQYEDADGFHFAYYSDGFFSFAVFETPAKVALPGGVAVELGGADYQRSFTAGQATYVWETRDGGMALVGDLPPDLHEAVLATLPLPSDPGLLRRIWRSLFG